MITSIVGWAAPPVERSVSGDAVHVWRVDLDQPSALVRQFAEVLSPDERKRAERYRFERDRRRFTIGRGTLRFLIASYLNLEPAEVSFELGPYGKPALPDEIGGGLTFNVSHSEWLAVVALGFEREIGLDIEYMHRLNDIDTIASQYFSPRECAALHMLPPDQHQAAFFAGWTRKEAYLKACGGDPSVRLDEFDVSLAPYEPPRLFFDQHDLSSTERWQMTDLDVDPEYRGALVVEGDEIELLCWEWEMPAVGIG